MATTQVPIVFAGAGDPLGLGLKGTKPAEIPVEANPKIEFTINLTESCANSGAHDRAGSVVSG